MKRRVWGLALIVCIMLCACRSEASEETAEKGEDTLPESEKIAAEYSELYKEASEAGTLAQLDAIRLTIR